MAPSQDVDLALLPCKRDEDVSEVLICYSLEAYESQTAKFDPMHNQSDAGEYPKSRNRV